jgi:peptidoglycan/xylan/chitin deacetylase (PgdA/CDA1 family)
MIEASIIIATYNRAERLQTCLEALARQDEAAAHYEVIVVVDGSTDGTREMLVSMDTPYALHVIFQPNSGQCAALNRGAAAAAGDICIFMDDDIVANPRLVGEHLRLHRERHSVAGIGQITLDVPPDADWFARGFAESWRRHYTALNQQRRQPAWEDCYGGNMSVARAGFLQAGGFSGEFSRGYDIELAYRLEQCGCSFVYLPGALGHQDERKGFLALAADMEHAGAASVAFCKQYPATLPHLLGGLGEEQLHLATMWRLLLALRISPRTLERVGRLYGGSTGAYAWFRFLHNYCFWVGVRHALTDRETWQRLVYRTPILMYHAFTTPGETPSRFVLSPTRFAQQMAWLKRLGYRVIGLEEYMRCRLEHRLPPSRSVIITIDDGYADNFSQAYPILHQYGFPATVFMVSNKVGGINDWDSGSELTGRPLLSWQDLQEMLRGGMTVGAHTRTHPHLTSIPLDQVRDEIGGARAELEEGLGAPIRLFSYPYGDHNAGLQTIVEQAGFAASCNVTEGANGSLTSLYALRRVAICGTDSLLDFAFAVRLGVRRHSLQKYIRERSVSAWQAMRARQQKAHDLKTGRTNSEAED